MYCQAALPNAGLGNKLFAWARCRVYSLEHGVPMLSPRWIQLKLGRWLRRDRDARVYHNLFRATPPGYVGGVRALYVRPPWFRLVDEPEDIRTPPEHIAERCITVFRGERDHFRKLAGWHDVLLRELIEMTRERWLRRAAEVGPVEVAIHVRRGDFVEASSEDDFIYRGGIRTPIEWFIGCLSEIRRMRGETVPAVVVSDAADSALAGLLDLESVRRIETGSAIGDLLVLSNSRVLVASGGSSFSAWAAFLGQMPAVAYPGQSLAWFKIAPMNGQYVGEWDHRQPTPRNLVQQIDASQQAAMPIGLGWT